MPSAQKALGADLRPYANDVGRYDANKVALELDWEQREIARYLAKDPSTVSRNPVSSAYQESLPRLVVLIQRLIDLAGGDRAAALAWMRTPLRALDNSSPKQLILDGHIAIVERLVDEFDSHLAL